MPLKILLKFRAEKPVELSSLKPKVAHGIVFSLFKGAPEVGELLHRGNVKPFSISIPSHFRYPERVVDRFGIVLNLLNNELFPKISPYLFFPESRDVTVDGVRASLISVRPLEVVTYQDLLEVSPSGREIVIDFLTPTAFKRSVCDYPVPEPSLVFGSLLKRWNAFSPFKIEGKLIERVSRFVTVSGCWIRTRKVEIMNGARLTGFVGRVFFYSFLREKEENRILNALALFSRFSGIGRKTTMGFGAVRVIEPEKVNGNREGADA